MVQRVHNINEDFQHYQYRIHDEEFNISKWMMIILFIWGAGWIILGLISPTKYPNYGLGLFLIIGGIFFLLRSWFFKWKRSYASR